MKPRRIIALCLLLSTLLTALLALSACKPRVVEITRYEQQLIVVGDGGTRAHFKSYTRFLEVYSYYFYKWQKYKGVDLPREGEFITEDGERFLATVKDISFSFSSSSKVHYITTVWFTLNICAPDGEQIMEHQIHSASISERMTVPEEIVRYWDAVKITPEELFGREREEG